jgi:hypothetical protein
MYTYNKRSCYAFSQTDVIDELEGTDVKGGTNMETPPQFNKFNQPSSNVHRHIEIIKEDYRDVYDDFDLIDEDIDEGSKKQILFKPQDDLFTEELYSNDDNPIRNFPKKGGETNLKKKESKCEFGKKQDSMNQVVDFNNHSISRDDSRKNSILAMNRQSRFGKLDSSECIMPIPKNKTQKRAKKNITSQPSINRNKLVKEPESNKSSQIYTLKKPEVINFARKSGLSNSVMNEKKTELILDGEGYKWYKNVYVEFVQETDEYYVLDIRTGTSEYDEKAVHQKTFRLLDNISYNMNLKNYHSNDRNRLIIYILNKYQSCN